MLFTEKPMAYLAAQFLPNIGIVDEHRNPPPPGRVFLPHFTIPMPLSYRLTSVLRPQRELVPAKVVRCVAENINSDDDHCQSHRVLREQLSRPCAKSLHRLLAIKARAAF